MCDQIATVPFPTIRIVEGDNNGMYICEQVNERDKC